MNNVTLYNSCNIMNMWHNCINVSLILIFAVGSSTANRTAGLRVLSVANDILKSLVPLACRKDNILVRLVAELIGLFCTIGKLRIPFSVAVF